MSRRIHACGVQELADGEMKALSDDALSLAICRVNDEWFAFENNCTHQDFPLTEGAVDGTEIECPLHGARFCLRTGAIRAVPASRPIRVFRTHVEGDAVHVEIP
jgi:nitrite reductase/ring-hydroxylating ferredoxin subunit